MIQLYTFMNSNRIGIIFIDIYLAHTRDPNTYTIPGQSEPVSNGIEVLLTPQIFRTGASPSDVV